MLARTGRLIPEIVLILFGNISSGNLNGCPICDLESRISTNSEPASLHLCIYSFEAILFTFKEYLSNFTHTGNRVDLFTIDALNAMTFPLLTSFHCVANNMFSFVSHVFG